MVSILHLLPFFVAPCASKIAGWSDVMKPAHNPNESVLYPCGHPIAVYKGCTRIVGIALPGKSRKHGNPGFISRRVFFRRLPTPPRRGLFWRNMRGEMGRNRGHLGPLSRIGRFFDPTPFTRVRRGHILVHAVPPGAPACSRVVLSRSRRVSPLHCLLRCVGGHALLCWPMSTVCSQRCR